MGFRVLIVEDDVLLLRLMKLKFEQSGYVVETAPDGASALAQIRKNKPDVVITELMLPKMDGFQLMREMEINTGELSTRVIVISFRNGAADRLQALKLGAIDFISKPLSLHEMVARVKLACPAETVEEGRK